MGRLKNIGVGVLTLPGSGQIGISDINTEMGTGGQRSLGQADGRELTNIPGGEISLADYYGKTWNRVESVSFHVETQSDSDDNENEGHVCDIYVTKFDGTNVRGSYVASTSGEIYSPEAVMDPGCDWCAGAENYDDADRWGEATIAFDPPVYAQTISAQWWTLRDSGDDGCHTWVHAHMTDGTTITVLDVNYEGYDCTTTTVDLPV